MIPDDQALLKGAIWRLVGALIALLTLILATRFSQSQDWKGIWMILFIFVATPLFIVSLFDTGAALRGIKNPSFLTKGFGLLLGVPQALFALLAAGIGLSIVGWVLYNTFVQQRPEYTGGFLTFGIAPIVLLYGLSRLHRAFIQPKWVARLISFKTSRFDPAKEPPNPINPIAGQSVLAWLREDVLSGAGEPGCEDWGWYMDVHCEGATYLVGSVCLLPEEDPAGPDFDWMLQIHKHRSFADQLLGRNIVGEGDPLVAKIVAALESDSSFSEIEESGD